MIRFIILYTVHINKKDNEKNIIKDELTEFLLYTSPNWSVKMKIFLYHENIWFIQKRIAELLGKGRSTITVHLQNIFTDGRLQEDLVSWDFRLLQKTI